MRICRRLRFLALTNFTTLGVLTTLAERGLRMPHDISLIGFDDYAWMRARATPLTAIVQPVREMAGPFGNAEREDQRRPLAGKNMSCCRASSGFAHPPALSPMRVPQPVRRRKWFRGLPEWRSADDKSYGILGHCLIQSSRIYRSAICPGGK
jgi:hypothetical protein